MSGLWVGTLAIGAGVSYAQSQNWWQGTDEEEGGGINLPSFYRDPAFDRTQAFLEPYGEGILSGENIPEYYKGIGESGGGDFENMLARSIGETKKASTENSARMGIRGDRGGEALSKAVGDIDIKSRYNDYLRSLKGKEFLMTQGRGITEGVRNAAGGIGGQQNVYNMGGANLAFQADQAEKEYQAAEDAAEDAAWSDMLYYGIGAARNMYAVNQLNTTTPVRGSAAHGGNPTDKSYAGGNWANYLD